MINIVVNFFIAIAPFSLRYGKESATGKIDVQQTPVMKHESSVLALRLLSRSRLSAATSFSNVPLRHGAGGFLNQPAELQERCDKKKPSFTEDHPSAARHLTFSSDPQLSASSARRNRLCREVI
jgi:hypothetical protein